MAIEWCVKIESETSFNEILRMANVFSLRIIGNHGPGSEVVALESNRDLDGTRGPASRETMGFRHQSGSYEGNGRSVVFSIPRYHAFSFLNAYGIGNPMQDEEFGNFIYVTSGRTRSSVVLSMISAIAAAVACNGQVWDESLHFRGDRINSPETLAQSIKIDNPHASFADAVDEVLSKTDMANYLLE